MCHDPSVSANSAFSEYRSAYWRSALPAFAAGAAWLQPIGQATMISTAKVKYDFICDTSRNNDRVPWLQRQVKCAITLQGFLVMHRNLFLFAGTGPKYVDLL